MVIQKTRLKSSTELLPSVVDTNLRCLDCKHLNILLAQKGIGSFIIKKKTEWTCGDNGRRWSGRGMALGREACREAAVAQLESVR